MYRICDHEGDANNYIQKEADEKKTNKNNKELIILSSVWSISPNVYLGLGSVKTMATLHEYLSLYVTMDKKWCLRFIPEPKHTDRQINIKELYQFTNQ